MLNKIIKIFNKPVACVGFSTDIYRMGSTRRKKLVQKAIDEEENVTKY